MSSGLRNNFVATIILIVLNLAILGVLWDNDRQRRLTRTMLDARARIQTTLVKTGHRRGVFTEEEIKAISDDWNAAEYNLVMDDPFLETK